MKAVKVKIEKHESFGSYADGIDHYDTTHLTYLNQYACVMRHNKIGAIMALWNEDGEFISSQVMRMQKDVATNHYSAEYMFIRNLKPEEMYNGKECKYSNDLLDQVCDLVSPVERIVYFTELPSFSYCHIRKDEHKSNRLGYQVWQIWDRDGLPVGEMIMSLTRTVLNKFDLTLSTPDQEGFHSLSRNEMLTAPPFDKDQFHYNI